VRLLGYLWALPVTAIGLALAAGTALSGGLVRVRGGLVEGHGGLAARLLRGGRGRAGGAAVALGHVVLARDAACLDRSRDHERHHVRQYERWGPLLPPAYWVIGAWLRWRGLHPYLDHPLEPPPAGASAAEPGGAPDTGRDIV
jgi:hypothetical protein